MQAKVKARLYEDDPKRLADEQEQAERRRVLEEQSRLRQEEAIKAKRVKENQKLEEEQRKKALLEQDRLKQLEKEEIKKRNEEKLKEEARQLRQADIEQARLEKEKKIKEKEQKKYDQQLEAFNNVDKSKREPPKPKELNTIQKITRAVQNNIQNIIVAAGVENGKKIPKRSND